MIYLHHPAVLGWNLALSISLSRCQQWWFRPIRSVLFFPFTTDLLLDNVDGLQGNAFVLLPSRHLCPCCTCKLYSCKCSSLLDYCLSGVFKLSDFWRGLLVGKTPFHTNTYKMLHTSENNRQLPSCHTIILFALGNLLAWISCYSPFTVLHFMCSFTHRIAVSLTTELIRQLPGRP